MSTLYFAYGSNLHIDQMLQRCPDAKPYLRYGLRGYKLVFRCVADIVPKRGAWVPGALYRITPQCEAALDRYEGFPILYRKEYIKTPMGLVMFYVMNQGAISPPTAGYFEVIMKGYRHWQLDAEDGLQEAVREAADNFTSPAVLQHIRRLIRGGEAPKVQTVAEAFGVLPMDIEHTVRHSKSYMILTRRGVARIIRVPRPEDFNKELDFYPGSEYNSVNPAGTGNKKGKAKCSN